MLFVTFLIRRAFDSAVAVSHSRYVLTFAKRLTALAAVLTLCVGHVAVCAGWQATTEARMACCKNGASCPMHKSESHRSSSNGAISQVQADTCCAAASNRTQSSVAGTTFVFSNATTLLPVAAVVIPVPVLALQTWRALVPLPPSPIPRHLLLSLLLV